MYNMIFLPERVDITKEKIENSLSGYMDSSKFNVNFKEGGAVINVMGKDFSFIYVDRKAPLEEVTDEYRHKAHLIISNLNKPKGIREGVDLQLALERFVLLVAIEMSGQFIYWSNTRKIETLEVLNANVVKSNKLYEGQGKPAENLPLDYWMAVRKESDTLVISGFSEFGEKDFYIRFKKEAEDDLISIVNYVISYTFNSGRFFKEGDSFTIPSGQKVYVANFGESLLLEV